jgi:O-antigen ligase
MLRKYLLPTASFLTVLLPVLLIWPVPADIALTTIAVLFLVHCWQQKTWGWCSEGWLRLLALLWMYMIARGLFVAHPLDAMARALPFVRYIVFAAALAHGTLADPETRRRFGIVLSGMVVITALDGLLQWGAGADLLRHPIIVVPSGGGVHLRLTGPYSKPILGIMLTWFAFPALLPLLLTPHGALKGSGAVLRGGALLLATVAAIALSGERIALLLLLMGCLAAGLLLPLRKRLLFAGLGGIVLLLGVLALASPEVFKRQVYSTQETLTHWQQSPYGMLLQSDLALAEKHPLIGMGTGGFHAACEELYAGDTARIEGMCKTHPHNIYLEWLIENGMIGLGLFTAFVVAVFRGCARVFRARRGDPLFVGMLIAFIFRAWPLMSSTGFFSRWGAPPFWLVLGALLVYTVRQPEHKRDADSSVTLQKPGL